MAELKRILLVGDNPNDVELALEALAAHCLANVNEPPPGCIRRNS